MKITRANFAKAITKQLAFGKRMNSMEVQKTLQGLGVDPRFAGEVKESTLKKAYDTLKDKGLLRGEATNAGKISFEKTVIKDVAAQQRTGLTDAQKKMNTKSLLKERLQEEATTKKNLGNAVDRITNIGLGKGTSDTGPLTTVATSQPRAVQLSRTTLPSQTRATPVYGSPEERATIPLETTKKTTTPLPTTPSRTDELPDLFGF